LSATWFVVSAGVFAEDRPSSSDLFEMQVRPTLQIRCVKCHGDQKQEGNLRLDTRDHLLSGGDSGQAVVPGDASASTLVAAIRHESFEMPPDGQLDPESIDAIARWIDQGAPWPEHSEPIRERGKMLSDQDRAWWAFQPVRTPPVPPVAWSDAAENSGGSTIIPNPIDAFVWQRLAARGMSPAPRAEKRTLIRRLYFDLLGLPPTPAEIDQFLADESPDAWTHVVDRLLEDPRYGEHWAQYWLDIVRYAESDGWNKDSFRDQIFRYRDYVVNAFNHDKPLPEFIREQLAGDQLPGDDPERLVATGFLRLGIYEYNQRDARGQWDDIMNEVTDVTADVFLGLGMACARCHDHKFDPILQRDYFRLRSFFEPMIWHDQAPAVTRDEHEAYERQLEVWRRETADIQQRIEELVAPYHERKWRSTVEKFPLEIQACFYKPESDRDSWEHQMAYLVSRQFVEESGGPLSGMSKEDKARYDALQEELAAHQVKCPQSLPIAMGVRDFHGRIAPTTVPDDRDRTPIEPGVIEVLRGSSADCLTLPDPSSFPASTGRRAALAAWLGDARNPLSARVYVNRIWQQHFGRGIVETANDFGTMGAQPTHPQLLDWLAAGFIEHGWSTKWLHKLILSSATWQQSAVHPQCGRYEQLDPEETLIWRAAVRRLSAEQIRDAMLSVSGELHVGLGGPSVPREVPRRSLYLKRIRNSPDELLQLFDAAAGLKSVAQRSSTTTPTQALLLINGEYGLARARAFAMRLINRGGDPQQMLVHAFQLVWGRSPSDDELAQAIRFVAAPPDDHQAVESARMVDPERLVDLCHVLLNSNEFLYFD
jgi:hypothetical protein